MKKIIITTGKEITNKEKHILKDIFNSKGLDIKINASIFRFSEIEILPLIIDFSLTTILSGVSYDVFKRIIKKILSDRRFSRKREITMIEKEKSFIITPKGFYLKIRKKSIKFSNIDAFFNKINKGKENS